LSLLLFLACSGPRSAPAVPAPAAAPVPDVAPEPEPVVVRLVATGDVLPHRRVKASARSVGWVAVFGDAVPYLQGADLAFANLESPIAPDHHVAIHDEVFDAPAALAPALAAAGIDVVSMANNHGFDQGPAGLVETWTRVRDAGVVAVGAGPDCAEARAARIVTVRGVRIAFLAVTDLVNIDASGDDAQPCLFVAGPVCTADCGPDRDAVAFSRDVPRLLAAVADARARADFVVLSFHWGIEYTSAPLPIYPPLADQLVDAGVDVILGHHPHVLQPIVERTTPDGRRAVVAFSLGNFVSNMREGFDPARDDPGQGAVRDGLLLEVPLVWRGPGRTTVGVPVAVPLWTENRPDGIRVRTLQALHADPASRALAIDRHREVGAIVGPRLLPLPDGG
jgi:poly-gamma-glutamate capsule biosynthesis protein CapA/YwtB (metallophosphatase superfamily)